MRALHDGACGMAVLLMCAAGLAAPEVSPDSAPVQAEAPPPVVDDRAPEANPCEREAPPQGCAEPSDAAQASVPVNDERAVTPPEVTVDAVAPGPETPLEAVDAEAPEPSPTAAGDAVPDPAQASAEGAEPAADPRAPTLDGAEAAELAAPAASTSEREGFGFGGVPALNYDADNGFGFGVVGSLYWYERGVRPYRYNLTLMIFATTKLVQDHQVRFDAVDLFDLPLRVTFRGGYYQSVTQNFCGFGNRVSCDPRVAQLEASRRGLSGDEHADFVRRYYLMRLVRPYAQLLARWRLSERPAKLEVMAGYRGHLLIPGDPWADDDGDGSPDLAFRPYAGSLYEKTFPIGEPGFASVATLGLMLDTRDQEASPTSGYWVEGSLRVSSTFLGSSWNYVGGNFTARTYVPLVRGARSVVLAQRLVLDATAGDLPVDEMIRVGGSWDYTAFGGNPMGRGVRVQRYVGRIKVLDQVELRADLFEHELLEQRFRWGVAGLVDAGWVGVDWTDFGGDPLHVNFGFGGGLRLAWNDDFVIRADLAASPDEGYAPSLYIDIGNTF